MLPWGENEVPDSEGIVTRKRGRRESRALLRENEVPDSEGIVTLS